ncbi:MAG: hypothetical protein ACYDBJ_20915 [Aggregatilineales bacterium]
MPSQIKQAEKRRHRSPLLPIYGIIIVVCLYIVAYALENPLADLIRRVAPQSSFILPPPDVQFTPTFVMPSTGRLLVAVVIWVVLLAFVYFLVSLLTGRDPDSAKNLQLPPRTKEEKRKRYSRDR